MMFKNHGPGYHFEQARRLERWKKAWGPKAFTAEYDEWILTQKFTDYFIAMVLRRTVESIKNRRQELLGNI